MNENFCGPVTGVTGALSNILTRQALEKFDNCKQNLPFFDIWSILNYIWCSAKNLCSDASSIRCVRCWCLRISKSIPRIVRPMLSLLLKRCFAGRSVESISKSVIHIRADSRELKLETNRMSVWDRKVVNINNVENTEKVEWYWQDFETISSRNHDSVDISECHKLANAINAIVATKIRSKLDKSSEKS